MACPQSPILCNALFHTSPREMFCTFCNLRVKVNSLLFHDNASTVVNGMALSAELAYLMSSKFISLPPLCDMLEDRSGSMTTLYWTTDRLTVVRYVQIEVPEAYGIELQCLMDVIPWRSLKIANGGRNIAFNCHVEQYKKSERGNVSSRRWQVGEPEREWVIQIVTTKPVNGRWSISQVKHVKGRNCKCKACHVGIEVCQ